tara:strand:+ start:170 stop:1513 length:1344 start_codon:yes stop_codon:yes gene_type:complete
MPKVVKELSELSIKRLRHRIGTGEKNPKLKGKPIKAMHAVGGVIGLYLQCLPPKGSEQTGARQWIYRATVGKKIRNIGLGSYPSLPTKNAREAARAIQESIKSGVDPVIAKASLKAQLQDEQRTELIFKQAAAKYVIKRGKEYKTAKQTQRLRSQLDKYVIPFIGNLRIEDIEASHLISMMGHYYEEVPDTAVRVINHVEKIVQQAIIEGQRTSHNPAIWHNNLSLSFPARNKIAPRKNHPFLPWQSLPEFMIALDGYDKPKGSSPDGACLAFIILTVSRPSEARLMRWSDVDLPSKVWTIQPSALKGDDRRKSSRTWQVPLTTAAIKILKAQPSFASQRGLVFTTLDKKEIPDAYFGSNINSLLGFEGVAHGFRTTFKTWCQEHGVVDEVSELALKHTDTDSTRAAYARSQLFDERKKVLAAYSKHAITGQSLANANVIPIKRGVS